MVHHFSKPFKKGSSQFHESKYHDPEVNVRIQMNETYGVRRKDLEETFELKAPCMKNWKKLQTQTIVNLVFLYHGEHKSMFSKGNESKKISKMKIEKDVNAPETVLDHPLPSL